MLDLQAVEQRANARTAATPATPATPATHSGEGTGSKVAAVAALAAAHASESAPVTPATSATPATRGDRTGEETGSRVAAVAAVAGDERITCGQCLNFDPEQRRCDNHRRAGLRSPWLGLDLPTLPQRCSGFAAGPPVTNP